MIRRAGTAVFLDRWPPGGARYMSPPRGTARCRRHQPHHPRFRREEDRAGRYIHNDRLVDALHQQAFCALTASPGARAYYDELRRSGQGHHAALRQLANRLAGILHGYLKTRTLYDEHTAWAHHNQDQQTAA